MAIHNPNSKENLAKEKADRRAKEEARQHAQDVERTLQRLMNSQHQRILNKRLVNMQRKENNKIRDRTKDVTRKHHGKRAAITRAEKATGKRNKYRQEEEEQQGFTTFSSIGIKGNFQRTTLKVFDAFNCKLKSSVGFQETGAHLAFGKWPKEFLGAKIDRTLDPANFFDDEELFGNDFSEIPKRELFACRPIMFWAPESRWPELYRASDMKPFCPFHPGCTSCIVRNGLTNYIRCVYDFPGISGLTGREYQCKVQKAIKESCTFYSYDASVVAQAPPYVQVFWRQEGFRITAKSGIRWSLVDQMRSLLAHGTSALGFRNSIAKAYKQAFAMSKKKWWSYADTFLDNRKEPFFDFESPQSEMNVPSLKFLLATTLEEIESYIPFYRHKMTMKGELFLSGDHFKKIGKVVLIDNERGFVGLYTVMNEFGKKLLWRLVNGTTLQEVESAL